MIINNQAPVSRATTQPEYQKLFDDLQGNILKAHARPNVKLLFIRFSNTVEDAKQWIVNILADKITSMNDQFSISSDLKTKRVFTDPGCWSFSLSKKGYTHLGLDLAGADQSFDSGLGSGTVPNDPPREQWETGYREDIHALIIMGHTEAAELAGMVQDMLQSLQGIATVVAEEDGTALPDEKEHFGFADGVSQPRFFTEDLAKEGPVQNWNPFAPLDLALAKDPNGKAFSGGVTGDGDFPVDDFSGDHSYGSYLVFRKLEQDVDGWNAEVGRVASQLNMPPELVGAYAVGRFQDGTPVLHPAATSTNPIENDFNYAGDPGGLKCPFHAHIRKTNPRGDTQVFGVPLDEEKKEDSAQGNTLSNR